MQMPGWMVTVPAGLIALVGVIADRGEKVVQVLSLLQAWTAKLPMGLWSFLLSLVLALLVWASAMRTIKRARDGSRPHNTANGMALAAAMVLTLAQQWVSETGFADKGGTLMALVIGLIAGLLAPFLGHLIRGCFVKKVAP